MELDQLLFKKILSIFGKKAPELSQTEKDRLVKLEDISGELTILARVLTGKPIDIFTAEREGGIKGKNIFLPEKFYLLKNKDLNIKYYQFRVFYFTKIYQLIKNKNTSIQYGKIEKDSTTDKVLLQELLDEFPQINHIYEELVEGLQEYYSSSNTETDTSWLLGTIRKADAEGDATKKMDNQFDEKALPDANTVVDAKPIEEIESVQVDKKGQDDWVLTHNFEKVETIEEYSGLPREFDGDDSLEDDAEALANAGIKHTVRVDDETHSIYQAEFISNANIADSKEQEATTKHYLYDEYNYKKREYRRNYCKVFYKKTNEVDLEYYKNTITKNGIILRSIRKKFANFFNKLTLVKRVETGETLNIDALTDMVSDIHSGHSPNEKIYDTKRKKHKDISILFLLDQSLSSDGYSGENRIIDVEKQIAILMGEVLNEYNIEFAIHGFSSKTRNNCTYNTFKSFDDNWDKAKAKIGTIQPSGFTRMGPALRHSTYLLDKRDSRAKWIVFLTDGKPNDYDKYEGKYGIADVKQALKEMDQHHISIHAFAIEQRAKYYLPLMFGTKNYNVLANPKELINAMTIFVERIVNG